MSEPIECAKCGEDAIYDESADYDLPPEGETIEEIKCQKCGTINQVYFHNTRHFYTRIKQGAVK